MPAQKSLITEAVRLSAMPFAESLTLLIYGGSGTGKTYFCGTAGSRTLIINIGAGLATLQAPNFTDKYKVNPLVATIPVGMDSHDGICDTLDYYIQSKSDEFDTIVIDDASSLNKSAMYKAIQVNEDLNKSQALANFKRLGQLAPGIQDYGEEINVVGDFLRQYTEIAKASNKHLIITAHERLTYRKAQKPNDPPTLVKIRPAFTGQTFPDNVPGFFDEVWRFTVVGRGASLRHRITTQPSEIIVAKSSHGGVFKEEEQDLDFPHVVQRIKSFKYVPVGDELQAVESA
jgi:hypothetical protein